MLEKFIDNDVMGFERVLRDIEKILLLKDTSAIFEVMVNMNSKLVNLFGKC